MQMLIRLIIPLLFTLSFTSTFANEAAPSESKNTLYMPSDIKWANAPNSLPKGAELAVLEGDPMQSGPFTMRIKLPANYQIPPHWHTAIERITIISGNFYLGMGEQVNLQKAKKYPTGSFVSLPPEMRHFAFTHSPVVVQLHGMGPWDIHYVNEQDDPRNKK